MSSDVHARLDVIIDELSALRKEIGASFTARPLKARRRVPPKLTADEAAPIASVGPSTMRKMAAKHHLGRKAGGKWVIDRELLFAFLVDVGRLPEAYRED